MIPFLSILFIETIGVVIFFLFSSLFCSKTLIADYQGYNCREFGNLGNAE